MNEQRTPVDLPRRPSVDPGYPDEPSADSMRLEIAVVILALVACLGGVYGWLQHRTVQELLSSREDLHDALVQARSQVDALSAKVSALSAAQAESDVARAQAEAAKNEAALPTAEPVTAPKRHRTHRSVAKRQSAEDPRWKRMQEQLGEQQKALDEEKQQLAETQTTLQLAKSELEGNLDAARTDLGAGIARNHEEFVALEKKGERNYFEFDIKKATGYHHTGPISISVRKADAKHQYCDLDMLVNDSTLSKKHINLYESVAFYPEGYPMPLEVVINRIGKDFVHGYVSEPKYRPGRQATVAANSPTNQPANPAPPVDSQPQLEHRPEVAH